MSATLNFEALLKKSLDGYYDGSDYAYLLHLESLYEKGLQSKPFLRDLESERARWYKYIFDRYQAISTLLRERGSATTYKQNRLRLFPSNPSPPDEIMLETVQFYYADYIKTGEGKSFDTDKLYRDVVALCKSEMEKRK